LVTRRFVLVSLVLGVILLVGTAFKHFSNKEVVYEPMVSPVCEEAVYRLGVRIDTLTQITYTPKKGESFKSVILKNGLSPEHYEKVRRASRLIVNLNYSIAGLELSMYKNDAGELKYAILNKNFSERIVLDLDKENPRCEVKREEVTTREREVVGIIKGDIYATFKELDIPRYLIYELDRVYDYTFNLARLTDGDTVKIKFEERIINGDLEKVRANNLTACVLTHGGKSYSAFYYKKSGENKGGFYDENGSSLKRSFLEKPLKQGRISSRYNKNRIHPVLKRRRAHLGTDFAAPHGTPIIATADGIVTAAAYTKHNGYYVKVKHDGTYTTQYLHMSRFARGIKSGKRVKQGDVIGYVGSTGLATGPHVCYRFWKNGVQVDPFRENLRFASKLEGKYQTAFAHKVHTIEERFSAIDPWNYQTADNLFASNIK